MVNVKRLKQLRQSVILARAMNTWNQDTWGEAIIPEGQTKYTADCKTAQCAAGLTCLLAGEKLAFEGGEVIGHSIAVDKTVSGKSIPSFAAKWLGLDGDQAEMLFLNRGFTSPSSREEYESVEEWQEALDANLVDWLEGVDEILAEALDSEVADTV